MKKLALALLAGAAFAPAVSMADAGDVLVRVRGLYIAPDMSGAANNAGVNVKQAVTPELDLTYMITKNIGAELILGTAKHDIKFAGDNLGSTWILPPTLTLQYHFMPDADFRPYVGAGLNYTRFYSTDLNQVTVGGKAGDVTLKKNSWGAALQVGADYAINKNVFVNVDVKKVWVDTKVTWDNTMDLGKLKINPWIIGVGIGTKF
ncbi:OmpW/AlkL family protein [Laribacter hongkongensis]|uniref:OmpW/AlkL family protein n=1 Tax=Laribacter hongkongensis TaxID=168471 RepID=UPI001877942B|nr:OmpW family outer membrane protein [Laribacter hongkongensis]MBE5528403.1 OmpW family protein [Laribacter hongkongensis]MCG9078075.1 outer membrane beta-barrel protein [Laribacter hongkongensis]MCG9079324.1 outer membrane beta-barrel protein [Laribacter hongkongensis]